MVYKIIDRTIAANGQEMLFPATQFNMYNTDPDEDIIELYHNHAICEQFHSEIRTNMERMPSGKFDTNALILKLGMITYNILRIIGTTAMNKNDTPVRHKTIKRRRIRTVIERLMLIAGYLTVHARKILLALGKSSPWSNTFIRIWEPLKKSL